ncbi:allophanate hydrolase subunit 1 [Clostridium sp.]|uniref:5-oxoprolinase subunit B family protein n=1 Tax=Clostridium sp. TaxID=1506 RepID=UPI0028FE3505|nr:allophanate hydrolase subunit 1 [Clostridium sp.]MDU3038171.1 allophanate hydrolase subunit 1 [Clostridium sp.]
MEELNFDIVQVSENCALIEFGNKISEDINKRIRIFCEYLDMKSFYGIIEYIPYFSSVSLIYDPLKIKGKESFDFVKKKLESILLNIDFSHDYKENVVEIPVYYGGEYGPDIEHVAKVNNITVDDVIKIHSDKRYLVYMIGFAPGFPYLGIPQGSVGIAGMQTGVYPIETPGGWQIIGQTPIKLFDINRENKTLLKCGDIAKFYPISYDEYLKIKEKIS